MDELLDVIRASWSAESAAEPDRWSPSTPSMGQCEATAQVIIEHLGGSLVMGEVFIDGEKTEHHWWNRFDTGDIDLTADQFHAGTEIRETGVIDAELYQQMRSQIRPAVRARYRVLAAAVREQLDRAELSRS